MQSVKVQSNGYLPFGESGYGHYSYNMGKHAMDRLAPIKDLLLDTLTRIPLLDKTEVFNIGDYAAADGSSSYALIRDVIRALKTQHGCDLQIQVIYEDQPLNDFNSLFKRFSGMFPDMPTYLNEFENVFLQASGTSFYKQCVPASSMHFIISAIAAQYLSTTAPVCIGSFHRFSPEQSKEAELLKQQAARDWELFVGLRSRELKPGGVLAIVALFEESEDDNQSLRKPVDAFYDLLDSVWQSMLSDDKITAEEFRNANGSVYHKNLRELKAPFQDQLFGLELECVKPFTIPCTFFEAWKEKKEKTGEDDREGYARQFTAAQRVWANWIFRKALSDDRSPKDKDAVMDEYFLRVQKKIALLNPGDMVCGCSLIYLSARKFRH